MKELETKTASNLPADLPSLADYGVVEISANDITIPRIQLMQPMSQKVVDGEAVFGELRDSMTNEVLGSFKETLEFIPFFMETLWVEYKVEGSEKEYLRMVPVVKDPKSPAYNDNWKYKDEGTGIERDRLMQFYVMLPKEIAGGAGIPYIISFRRTSLQSGRKLATQMFVKNIAASKLPCAVACKLVVKKESNDKGSFAVVDVEPTRPSTVEEQQAAIKWLGPIKSGQAKRDDREVTGETDAVVDATETSDF